MPQTSCHWQAIPHEHRHRNSEELAALFKSARVIPVLTIERLEDAVPLARALVAGGVRVLEVTLADAGRDRGRQGDHGRGAGRHRRHRHHPERATILRAPRRSARAFGISPGATPELLEGGRRQRPAVRAGHRDRFGTDAGAGARLRPGQILPGGAIRRHQGAAGAGRAVSRMCGFARPAGIGEANAAAWLAEPNVVGGRRFLALPGGGYPRRQLGRHNRHLPADHENR